MSITGVKQIYKSVYNRKQARNDIKSHPIGLTDSDNYFILDEIKCKDTIEYERYISVNDKED